MINIKKKKKRYLHVPLKFRSRRCAAEIVTEFSSWRQNLTILFLVTLRKRLSLYIYTSFLIRDQDI